MCIVLNIVLPIAGRGSRFAEVGYTTPKPLILVHGVPMIEVVVENVRPSCLCRTQKSATVPQRDIEDVERC